MIEAFLEFENRHNLFLESIAGFAYWPYIRFSIYESLFDNVGSSDNKYPKIQISDVFSMIKNITLCNPLIRGNKRDILFICHQRRLLDNCRYICIYTDLIAEKFGRDSICAEFPYGYKHFKPTKSRDILMLDIVDIVPAVQSLIAKNKYKKIFLEFDNKAKQIGKLIALELEMEIDSFKLANWMKKRYLRYQYKKPIIKKLLRKINPKIIVEVVGYETDKMILNEVANELNICTIELQHGVIGRGHCAYNYLGERKYNYMPSKLFVFSEYWKKTCRFPIGEKNIVSTGFPYMEKQMNLYPPSEIDRKILRIIVISQPGITEKLLDFTCSIIKEMQSMGLRYKIVYKFHPAEYNFVSEKSVLLQKCQNVHIIRNSDVSLYKLFSICDFQIGVNSTAIFEGLNYDLATFIFTGVDADVENYMCDLKQNKHVYFGNKTIEFLGFIEDCKNRKKGTAGNLFFVENALETTEREINSILENLYE